MTPKIEPSILQWDISVPIFRNKLILKQLGLAIGLPFGILALILILTTKEGQWRYTLYALGLIGALLLLSALFLLIVYRGSFHLTFLLNEEGILTAWHPDQQKKNRLINSLTFWGGLASGKPTAAGAGILAQSRQTVLIKWKSIRKIKYDSSQYTIYVKGGIAESTAVFCTPEIFNEVDSYIRSKTAQTPIRK